MAATIGAECHGPDRGRETLLFAQLLAAGRVQMRVVPSLLAVTTVLPSGLKAAALIASMWPCSWWISCPVAASQIRAC